MKMPEIFHSIHVQYLSIEVSVASYNQSIISSGIAVFDDWYIHEIYTLLYL